MPTDSSQALNKFFFVLDVIKVHSELSRRKKKKSGIDEECWKVQKKKLNSHHMLEITTDQGNSTGHGRLPAACKDLGKVCAFFKRKKNRDMHGIN